jgi:hypothetical protein
VPRVTAFNLRPGDDLAALEKAIFAALVSLPKRTKAGAQEWRAPTAGVRVGLRSYPIDAAGWVSR